MHVYLEMDEAYIHKLEDKGRSLIVIKPMEKHIILQQIVIQHLVSSR